MGEGPKNINFFLIFGAAIAAAGLIYLPQRVAHRISPSATRAPSPPLPPSLSQPNSPSTETIVYGVWRSEKAEIRAINVDGTNDSLVAFLPSAIKDIHVLSENELLYIAGTNQRDHGAKIEIYDLTEETTHLVVEAETGWGIDDFVISPDQTWIAWWEVKFAQGKNILAGGNSRVYLKQLAKSIGKQLVVDDLSSPASPVRYPLFFDRQNRLYLDTFLPDGGGWNLGLFVADSGGTGLTKMEDMADGMFSADPAISPDGNKIIFPAYDPTAPILLRADDDGIRRPAIANPNLVQVLDLQTRAKTTLLGSANGAQYGQPRLSHDETNIVFHKFKVSGPTVSEYQGVFSHNLTIGQSRLLKEPGKATFEILGFSDDDAQVFFGVHSETDDVGNLGENYTPLLKEIKTVNLATGEIKNVVQGAFLQFIGLIPKDRQSPLGIKTSSLTETTGSTLKLKSFTLKALAALRALQQNGGVRCRQKTEYVRELEKAGFLKEASELQQRKCSDSPLYLYPEKDTWVEIEVKPPAKIIGASPHYQKKWAVWADRNGQLTDSNGQIFEKISYAYLTSDFPPPNQGLVITQAELAEELAQYAQKVGLLGREIKDFVFFWTENLPPAPYYLISHFSQKMSARIMPLEIKPEPDTVLQVVMYFQPLASPLFLEPPNFEPIPKRQGFVVVDWSGIVDY